MTSAKSYPYESLDVREIRIIRFQEPDPTHPGLVHCSLEHVSLDDHLPAYAEFLKECRSLPKSTIHKQWIWDEAHISTNNAVTDCDQLLPVMASWRKATDADHQGNLLSIMKVDKSDLPEMPSVRPVLRRIAPAESQGPPDLINSKRRAYTAIKSRFRWGDYEALSYCWESDVRDKAILLNGELITITTNLEAMLQHLKSLPEARSGLGFWVDGLCIDQDSTTEKNHQVRLMKDIFQQAYALIVWLGPGSNDTDGALSFAVQLCDIQTKIECDNDKPDIETWLKGSRGDTNHWAGLHRLLSRHYFQRMWIIQELALNASRTMLVCGTRQVSRQTLVSACDILMTYTAQIEHKISSSARLYERHRRNVPTQSAGGSGSLNNDTTAQDHCDSPTKGLWETAYNTQRLLLLRGEGVDIDTTLDIARKANATDDRDKVYGLLGLLPPEVAKEIDPDYATNNSTKAVYIQFARTILSNCKSLDEILSWCSFNERSTWPSWVPDWSAPFERYHVRWFRSLRATRHIERPCLLSTDGLKLSCEGALIDTIANLTAVSSSNLPYRISLDPVTFATPKNVGYGRYGDIVELRVALHRTLMHYHPYAQPDGDLTRVYWIDWKTVESSSDYDDQLEDLWTFGMKRFSEDNDTWKAFDGFRQRNAHFLIFGHQFRDMFPDMREYRVRARSKHRHPGAEVDRWVHTPYEMTAAHGGNMKRATISLRGRRLATTKGGCLGMVPDAAHAEDSIAFLLGCNYPVVLRPCDGGYKYIGECFVDVDMTDPTYHLQEADTIVLC